MNSANKYTRQDNDTRPVYLRHEQPSIFKLSSDDVSPQIIFYACRLIWGPRAKSPPNINYINGEHVELKFPYPKAARVVQNIIDRNLPNVKVEKISQMGPKGRAVPRLPVKPAHLADMTDQEWDELCLLRKSVKKSPVAEKKNAQSDTSSISSNSTEASTELSDSESEESE